MKPIVLLSGPVGAGKSTVAKELIAISPAPLSYIEGDTFWSFIAKDGSWFLAGAHAMMKRFGAPVGYVVLRPSEAVCAARAAARPEGTIRDYTSLRDLYAAFDGAPRHAVSDDVASAGAVAKRIREGLDAGTFRMR